MPEYMSLHANQLYAAELCLARVIDRSETACCSLLGGLLFCLACLHLLERAATPPPPASLPCPQPPPSAQHCRFWAPIHAARQHCWRWGCHAPTMPVCMGHTTQRQHSLKHHRLHLMRVHHKQTPQRSTRRHSSTGRCLCRLTWAHEGTTRYNCTLPRP